MLAVNVRQLKMEVGKVAVSLLAPLDAGAYNVQAFVATSGVQELRQHARLLPDPAAQIKDSVTGLKSTMLDQEVPGKTFAMADELFPAVRPIEEHFCRRH